jgi:hypothetical protein
MKFNLNRPGFPRRASDDIVKDRGSEKAVAKINGKILFAKGC